MIKNLLNIIIFLSVLAASLIFTSVSCHAQSNKQQEDTRSKNRRFADSMYYVHTVKKQQEINKKQDISAEKKITLKINSDKKTSEGKQDIPSSTLYQQTWVTERVKAGNISLKDLPDELTIRLCGQDGKGKFYFPYKGIRTSPYGWRWGRAHTGVDIALKTGDNVYAAFDGVVRVAKFNGGYGNMVLIRHYNNLETLYGHMSVLKVKTGQKVKAGDVIGLGGSTGHSTGPHLHFECRLLYACIDPEWIVDLKNNCLKTKILKIDKSFFGITSSQALSENKTMPTKLSKVNRCLEGTHYVSKSELTAMTKKKEQEKNEFAVINNNDKSTWRYYQVKQGDTIESICEHFRLKEKDFYAINNLKDKTLKEKQRIRVR